MGRGCCELWTERQSAISIAGLPELIAPTILFEEATMLPLSNPLHTHSKRKGTNTENNYFHTFSCLLVVAITPTNRTRSKNNPKQCKNQAHADEKPNVYSDAKVHVVPP